MECDVINDNDVMDATACFTLADGRSSACESRDLSHMTSSSFDPLQSTLAHRFRSAGGYTCVTLLSPDRDDLLPEPEMLMAAVPDNAHRCMEPLLQTGSRKPIAEHARRAAAVNTDGVCSTCVAKHRHLQSQHAPRRPNNMAAPDDVTEAAS